MQSYAIGRLTLSPHRELLDGGTPVPIGSRALDLLSALAAADGEVVCKDVLLAKVWPGAIVEDNALQAQVSAARKALGSESRRLVTIHGRGYRLDLNGAPAAQSAAPRTTSPADPPRNDPSELEVAPSPHTSASRLAPRWTRRAVVGGLATVAAAGGLTLVVVSRFRNVPDPRALELYRRGQAIENIEPFDWQGQATELYKQAVAIDPEFADAWGALALSYRQPRLTPLTTWSDPRLVRSAAERALALDAENANAQLALIRLYPPYRRWLSQEAQLRAFLARHPASAYGNRLLAALLLDVGRCEDALACARRAMESDPASRRTWFILGLSLTFTKRYHEALLTIDTGAQQWPQETVFWTQRFTTLFYDKRYAEAGAFLRSDSRRPQQFPQEAVNELLGVIDAVVHPAKRAKMIERIRKHPARSHVENVYFSAPLWLALGMVDELFAAMAGYFLGGTTEGQAMAPPRPLDPRPSLVLFSPSMLEVRSDPRFVVLLRRTGLENYWLKSGTRPDFQRQ